MIWPDDLLQQGVLDARLAEEIVGGHAGLAAVEVFSKDDAPGCQLQIRSLVHDAGALSSQLQGDRREVLSGVEQDLPAHCLAACEEDIVELLLQQAGVLLPASGDHRDMLRGKALRQEPGDDPAGGRGVCAGLDHRSVSGGQGIDQGVQGEEQGVVPRAHDEDGAVGGGLDIAPGGELGQGGPDPAVSGEGGGAADHIGQLTEDHAHLAHIALKGALAQVGPEGVVQLLLPGSHCGPQGAEGLNARPGRQGRTALKIGPLPGDELPDLHLIHG